MEMISFPKSKADPGLRGPGGVTRLVNRMNQPWDRGGAVAISSRRAA